MSYPYVIHILYIYHLSCSSLAVRQLSSLGEDRICAALKVSRHCTVYCVWAVIVYIPVFMDLRSALTQQSPRCVQWSSFIFSFPKSFISGWRWSGRTMAYWDFLHLTLYDGHGAHTQNVYAADYPIILSIGRATHSVFLNVGSRNVQTATVWTQVSICGGDQRDFEWAVSYKDRLLFVNF